MKVALLGDIALIGKYSLENNPRVEESLLQMKALLQDCDFVVGNLESPLTSKTATRVCKGVYLRGCPSDVKTLRFLGVTHVSLANNHIFDYGVSGARETAEILKENGIQAFGLGGEPAFVEKGNDRILLEGFCCYSANGLRYGNGLYKVSTLDYSNVRAFIRRGHELSAIPIVSAHFGVEDVCVPSQEHIGLFRELCAEGSFVLHGNHPHVLQGYEHVGESFLSYSQGNFCFDDCLVTSIGRPSLLQSENKKSSIIILDICENRVADVSVKMIEAHDNGEITENAELYPRLERCCDALKKSGEEFAEERASELEKLRCGAERRDLHFYLKRLNYKYVGAFLRGQSNRYRYNTIYGKYIVTDCKK